MRRVACLVLLSSGLALAHGGPETSQSIAIRRHHDADVVVSTTFGSVHTHDTGATWRWMCEQPFGYAYPFPASYLYTAAGEEMATGYANVTATRDGCTVRDIGSDMISAFAIGSDEALYLTTVGVANAHIYRTTDDGVTLPVAATAGQVGDWYTSIAVAPSDPSRVYVGGYRIVGQDRREWQLYASRDGGQTYAPIGTPPTDLLDPNASMNIAAIDIAAPDSLYVRIDDCDGTLGAQLWRSDDAGATWKQLFQIPTPLVVFLRANGDLIASTAPDPIAVSPGFPNGLDLPPHTWLSHDRGDHFTELPLTLHLACFTETSTGELWACTREQSPFPTVDGASVMRTTDLVTWTPVLKLADIAGPVECPADSLQAQACAIPGNWCILAPKLGVTADQPICTQEPEPAPPGPGDPPHGCDCDSSGGGGPGALALASLVALVARRRR